ncbi:MAG: hypothetical protein MZV63_71250 [Marinilabiliales bacterium]|nr:hypothetical protein [Marinilabiliales bacterium]
MMSPTSLITALSPRRNYIIRKASNLSRESQIIASNIDQAFLMISVKMPSTPVEFIDRFLATSGSLPHTRIHYHKQGRPVWD